MINEIEQLIDRYLGEDSLPNDIFTSVNEEGIEFTTGKSVIFKFLKNTESSKKFGNFGSRFQQNIEPAGMYVVHNESPGDLPDKWISGNMSFSNPLVIKFNLGNDFGYNDSSWKAVLYTTFKKHGKSLSSKLRQIGYDGIVTVWDGSTREIVKL
jgi:hypothetical protein